MEIKINREKTNGKNYFYVDISDTEKRSFPEKRSLINYLRRTFWLNRTYNEIGEFISTLYPYGIYGKKTILISNEDSKLYNMIDRELSEKERKMKLEKYTKNYDILRSRVGEDILIQNIKDTGNSKLVTNEFLGRLYMNPDAINEIDKQYQHLLKPLMNRWALQKNSIPREGTYTMRGQPLVDSLTKKLENKKIQYKLNLQEKNKLISKLHLDLETGIQENKKLSERLNELYSEFEDYKIDVYNKQKEII